MTQLGTTNVFVASFEGVDDQPPFPTLQSAMTYAESLTEPTGYIGYKPDDKTDPVALILYAKGNASLGAQGGVEQFPEGEEWT